MNNLFDLTGRKAIVVGGAGDLGAGMTEGLLEAGADVVVIDLSIDRLRALQQNFLSQNLGKIGIVKADISDREQIESSFEEARTLLNGHVDILLNTAGIQIRHACEEFPMKDWDKVLEINLTATFRFCQLAALDMIPRGKGKIINVASMLSFFGGYTVPAYAASKGGVAQLTKAFSNEWASKGIQVNAIAPGYMDTRLNVAIVNDPVRSSEILARIPARRWGAGSDLKGVAVFLASDASDYVSGAIIPVDGGYLSR